MLEGKRRYGVTGNYRVFDGKTPVASARLGTPLFGPSRIIVGDVHYRMNHEGIFGNTVKLWLDKQVVGQVTTKRGVSREAHFSFGNHEYVLARSPVNGESFRLYGLGIDEGINEAKIIGTVVKKTFPGIGISIDLPPELPLLLRVFVFWRAATTLHQDRLAGGAIHIITRGGG